jgi:hypothetical protein
MARVDCYSREFKKLAHDEDFEYTLRVLSDLRDEDKAFNQCHFAAHEIADEEAKKDPSRWKDVILRVKPLSCAGGFVAGAMRVALSDPEAGSSLEDLSDFCSSFADVSGRRECSHGLGHIILVEKSGFVLESIEGCDELTFGMGREDGAIPCWRGVFMESFLRDNLKSHGLAGHLSVSDQGLEEAEAVCHEFEGEIELNCWRELMHFYVILENFDSVKVLERCDHIPMQEARIPCAVHALSWLGASVGYDYRKMAEICSGAFRPPGIKQECVLEFLRLIALFAKNPQDATSNFCKEFDKESGNFCIDQYEERFSKNLNNYYDLNFED